VVVPVHHVSLCFRLLCRPQETSAVAVRRRKQDETVEWVADESSRKTADVEISVKEMFAILLQGQKSQGESIDHLARDVKVQSGKVEHLAREGKAQGETIGGLEREQETQGESIDRIARELPPQGKKIDDQGKKLEKLSYDVGCVRGDADAPRIITKLVQLLALIVDLLALRAIQSTDSP
jgi:hypothetical protein